MATCKRVRAEVGQHTAASTGLGLTQMVCVRGGTSKALRAGHGLSAQHGCQLIAETGKYSARILANGKREYLGVYDTPEAAGWAYDLARRYLGKPAKNHSDAQVDDIMREMQLRATTFAAFVVLVEAKCKALDMVGRQPPSPSCIVQRHAAAPSNGAAPSCAMVMSSVASRCHASTPTPNLTIMPGQPSTCASLTPMPAPPSSCPLTSTMLSQYQHSMHHSQGLQSHSHQQHPQPQPWQAVSSVSPMVVMDSLGSLMPSAVRQGGHDISDLALTSRRMSRQSSGRSDTTQLLQSRSSSELCSPPSLASPPSAWPSPNSILPPNHAPSQHHQHVLHHTLAELPSMQGALAPWSLPHMPNHLPIPQQHALSHQPAMLQQHSPWSLSPPQPPSQSAQSVPLSSDMDWMVTPDSRLEHWMDELVAWARPDGADAAYECKMAQI